MPKQFQAQPERVETFLRRVPLFAEVDPASLKAFVGAASFHSYELGETVFRQGEPGDAFYLIVKGSVRVVSTPDPKDPDREVSLGTLGPGDHFGELALLTGQPRTSGCRVTGEDAAALIRVEARAFQAFLERVPALRERLGRLGDFYRVSNFLKLRTPLGEVLGPDELRRLIPLLAVRRVDHEDVIAKREEKESPFVLVQRGSIRVLDPSGQEGILGEGKYWGEVPILAGVPTMQAVLSDDDEVELLLVPRRAFQEFLAACPRVREFLQAHTCRPVDARQVSAPPQSINFTALDDPIFMGLEAVQLGGRTAPVPAPPASSRALPAQRPAAPPSTAPKPGASKAMRRPWLMRVFRFPFVRQHDETDCGAASLAMICRFHGKRLNVGRLRDLANVSTEGASLRSLASAAESLGFVARGAQVKGEPVSRQPLPAIVHWGGFHFVVLYRIDRRHAWIADPGIGLRRLTLAEFEAKYTGYMLLLEPTERFTEVREAKTSFRRFLNQLAPYTTLLFEVAMASLILDLFGLAAPLFTQTVVDKVIPHQNERLLWVMLIGMLILAFFRIATQAVRGYLVANLSMRLDLRLLLKFYYHVLALPVGFFKLRKTGDILTRFGENQKLRTILTGSAISTILDVLMVVVYLALMFWFNAKLTLAVMACVPMFIVATLVFTPLLKRMSQRVFVANADQESHLVESVTAIETVKALAVERPVRWRWEGLFTRYLSLSYGQAKLEIVLGSISEGLSSLTSVALLGYGAWLVMQNELTVGQLMAFNALVGCVMAPIGALIQLWDKIQQAIVSMDRLNDVLDSEPEEAGGPASLVDPREIRGDIRFERVFFRYGTSESPYVLENVTCRIEPGSTVAIVGRSGSGKSTLVRLILKLYLPSEGVVMIDDLDIASISAQGLRRRIGFVPQEVNLFSGTIAENIALGVEEIDRKRIEEVARIAEAHGFISAMPLGYDTLVGERGNTLSGGQRQRISIARALYHDPRILILDEATASLDTESEAAIQQNLRAITSGRTAIIIAHRMSTVRHADKILVLDKGQVVEEGDHAALMEKRGLYHQLVSRQLEL